MKQHNTGLDMDSNEVMFLTDTGKLSTIARKIIYVHYLDDKALVPT